MSDIGVSYDLHYSPNPVGVNLKLGVSNTTLKVTLGGVPALAVAATPHFSGNILEAATSAMATPLANAITLSLGAFAGQIINGKSFDVTTIPNLPFNVEGVSGTLKPKNLKLSEFNGQLKIGGDFNLS
ncbi:hypothetical protein [Endozoicomonas sp. Mp262]|uniref:hypothetical protein n=1 Tax=Endozoicomonas sp. Mp262 TaxID=2919499 RepID=UPI0021DB0B37